MQGERRMVKGVPSPAAVELGREEEGVVLAWTQPRVTPRSLLGETPALGTPEGPKAPVLGCIWASEPHYTNLGEAGP